MDLRCFDEIRVHGFRSESRRILADYSVVRGGVEESYRLIVTYEEPPDLAVAKALGPLLMSIPAINYGLFAERMVFDVPLHPLDVEFIKDMTRVTAADIFVNRIVRRTGLLREEFLPDPDEVGPEDAEPRAELVFPDLTQEDLELEGDSRVAAVMLSGGKESLLTYAMLSELGFEAYPCFFNESGHHWFTALTAYRWFRENEPRTKRVWSNLDRLFMFVNARMKIVVDNIRNKRKTEVYPIQLFFFPFFIFSFLPVLSRYRVGNALMGNEYDDLTEVKPVFRGIRHYFAVYDQSQDFERYITGWFAKRGVNVRVWSAVRPITGLIVERILASRYPHLFRLQRSCHSVHKEGDRILPCGTCFKCNGVLTFLLANGIDPRIIGYREEHVRTLPDRLRAGRVRLDKSELEHSLYLLNQRYGLRLEGARRRDEVEMIRFDGIGSSVDEIPPEFWGVYDILEQYSLGYAVYRDGRWVRVRREALGIGL